MAARLLVHRHGTGGRGVDHDRRGGVSALQSFIVITAVPVSLLILPALWDAPRIALAMAREQLGQRRGVGEAV